MILIDDSNWKDFINPVVDGETMRCARTPRDMSAHPQSFQAAPLIALPRLSDQELKEIIKERKAKGARQRDLMEYSKVQIKNQSSTNYCWMNATIRLIEATRAQQGQPYVSLSPASCAAVIKNYRNVGGYGLEAIEFLVDTGSCPTSMWPDNAIDHRYKTAASDAAREQYKGLEYGQLATGDLDQLNTWLVKYGPAAVGLSWWGHEVLLEDLDWDDRTGWSYEFANSWGANWSDHGYGKLSPSKARGDYVVMRSAMAS